MKKVIKERLLTILVIILVSFVVGIPIGNFFALQRIASNHKEAIEELQQIVQELQQLEQVDVFEDYEAYDNDLYNILAKEPKEVE